MSNKRLARSTFLTFGLVFTCTSIADDLSSVYELALQNDPEYQQAQANYQAQLESLPQARAAFKPSVALETGRSRRSQDIDSDAQFISEGDASFNTNNLFLGVTQPIYNRPDRLAIEQATIKTQIAELKLTSAKQELTLRVVENYFALLATQDNLELALSEKTAIQQQLDLAQERLNTGFGIKTDLYDAQARFQLAEVAEIDARIEIKNAHRALTVIIGQNPEQLANLKGSSALEVPEANLEELVSRTLQGNLKLEIRRLENEVSGKEIDRQKAARYPSIGMNASQTFRDQDGTISGPGIDEENLELMLQLRLSLYNGGLISSRIKEVAFLHEANVQQLETDTRIMESEIEKVFFEIESDVKRTQALEQAVVAAQSAVESKESGYTAGLYTNLDILDAQRDLFLAKRDHLHARYQHILNVLRLEQITGNLDREDIKRVNTWLQ